MRGVVGHDGDPRRFELRVQISRAGQHAAAHAIDNEPHRYAVAHPIRKDGDEAIGDLAGVKPYWSM